MSATDYEFAGLTVENEVETHIESKVASEIESEIEREVDDVDVASNTTPSDDSLPRPTLDLSASTLNRALRDVALEELALVQVRYAAHRDPVRCAVGISLVLRSLARDLFGEERINRLRQVSWLNFLLRTSNSQLLRPDVLETLSAALFGNPREMDLPRDCTFWFEAAEGWIDHQRSQLPHTTWAKPVEIDL